MSETSKTEGLRSEGPRDLTPSSAASDAVSGKACKAQGADAARAETVRSDTVRKAPGAFRTISEVAEDLGIPQHVLRFWESKFAQIKPIKRGGGRRYYRPEDVDLLRAIQALLYDDKYTIKGAQQLIREQGVKAIIQTFGGFAGAAAQNAEYGIHTQLAVPDADAGGMSQGAGLGADQADLFADLRGVLRELEAIQAALLAPVSGSAAG